MLLNITTTHRPATDMGYLLGKNPERLQTFSIPFGKAHVFYPQADDECCSVVLYADIDPVGLVRGRGEGDGVLAQYVNDRPYTASSFLSVAMARVFSSALSGRSRERPELALTAIPLQAHLPVIRCQAGEEKLRECFEPLGYQVDVMPIVLDAHFPQWGESGYFDLKLSATIRLSDLLMHLYVLLPAIDGSKHYYIGEDEVQKLIEKGRDWLLDHPQREWIMNRYLKRQRSLVHMALEKLLEDSPDVLLADEQALEEEADDVDVTAEGQETGGQEAVPQNDAATVNGEQALEKPLSLNAQRMNTVVDTLVAANVHSVVDLGCGEGRLLRHLLGKRQFEKLLGIDVSNIVLERAFSRLKLDRLPPMKRKRIELAQGSLTYRDARLQGFDAACAIEVIEHMDAERIPAFERALFEYAQPPMVIVTTPNVEYNARFEGLADDALRHKDHRFEWTRSEFERWANGVCERYGYRVEFVPIGQFDPEVGAPTQMGVFRR